MRRQDVPHPTRRERLSAVLDTARLTFRALREQRMGALLPLAFILLVLSLAGMAVGVLLSPLALLPRGAQVAPFIYPLF
mgnify:CR=1 FL=1